MSQNANPTYSEKLGVGAILSQSFSIFGRNLVPVMLLGFVPTLIGFILSGAINGWDVALGLQEPDFSQGGAIGFLLSGVVQIAIYAITTGLLVQFSYDAKLGRPYDLGRYVRSSVSAVPVIVILTLISSIVIGLAAVVLILPGLWVYAVFSVMVPAVVIERAGFGGLARSTELTKGFRWPILGALILVGLCTGVLTFVIGFLTGYIGSSIAGSVIGTVVMVLGVSALTAVSYGLSGIAVALIYARLREIKEGLSVDQIAAVFD